MGVAVSTVTQVDSVGSSVLTNDRVVTSTTHISHRSHVGSSECNHVSSCCGTCDGCSGSQSTCTSCPSESTSHSACIQGCQSCVGTCVCETRVAADVHSLDGVSRQGQRINLSSCIGIGHSQVECFDTVCCQCAACQICCGCQCHTQCVACACRVGKCEGRTKTGVSRHGQCLTSDSTCVCHCCSNSTMSHARDSVVVCTQQAQVKSTLATSCIQNFEVRIERCCCSSQDRTACTSQNQNVSRTCATVDGFGCHASHSHGVHTRTTCVSGNGVGN